MIWDLATVLWIGGAFFVGLLIGLLRGSR